MMMNFRALTLMALSLSALLLCPAVARAQALAVLQAESMPTKTGGEVTPDGTAWAFTEKGHISQPVTFAKGEYRLEVSARGTRVRGAWPVMQLRVDGAAVGAPITVSSSEWSVYSAEAFLPAGTKSLSVELTNGYFDRRTNTHRLLEVDQVSVEQVSAGESGVPWSLTVVFLDPMDPVQQAEIPVKEAVSFIEERTRLVFDVHYVWTYSAHGYTPYRFGPDNDGDGQGDEVAYLTMAWNVAESDIGSLPVTSSYLLLYNMNGLRPLQAGSALGLNYAIWTGGKPHPYASVPVDQWWYKNEPFEGFKSRAAQILTHEIINTIQGKVESAPYHCPQLTGTSSNATQYESERLFKLGEVCYQRLGSNVD